MDIEKTVKNLERRGFEVSRFETKEEAAEYLTGKIHDTTVGIGGSKTAQQMGLYEKLCDDFDSALYRARNVAATQNATRFDVKTPCKIDGKCHDCRSPQRICNALLVLWGPMMEMESVEVVLINEELGI